MDELYHEKTKLDTQIKSYLAQSQRQSMQLNNPRGQNNG